MPHCMGSKKKEKKRGEEKGDLGETEGKRKRGDEVDGEKEAKGS